MNAICERCQRERHHGHLRSVKSYLSREGVDYDTLTHPATQDASHTAQVAHIPGDRLAKGVVLQDGKGYVIAAIPASHKLDLEAVARALDRDVAITRESELRELFQDCEPGAVPALGQAYGIETVVDRSFTKCPAVYFEGGDRISLIRVSGSDFHKLTANSPRRYISRHV
jgi:Ala-tRNA(Pro) deacylase